MINVFTCRHGSTRLYSTDQETQTKEPEMLLQKAKRLEDEAELAWHVGDDARGVELDKEVSNLHRENERRIAKAKSDLQQLPQTAQDSGMTNADDTFAGNKDALYMCEFWECAVDSAQIISDCVDYF